MDVIIAKLLIVLQPIPHKIQLTIQQAILIKIQLTLQKIVNLEY